MENQADSMESFVTVQQAAKLLNLPMHRIRKMMHGKELPALKVGSQWRIPPKPQSLSTAANQTKYSCQLTPSSYLSLWITEAQTPLCRPSLVR